jgi:hypothetical protein
MRMSLFAGAIRDFQRGFALELLRLEGMGVSRPQTKGKRQKEKAKAKAKAKANRGKPILSLPARGLEGDARGGASGSFAFDYAQVGMTAETGSCGFGST